MTLAHAAVERSIKTAMERTKTEVREYRDFTILVPDRQQGLMVTHKHATLLLENGIIRGVYDEAEASDARVKLQQELSQTRDLTQTNYEWVTTNGEGRIILPPFADCHTHLAMSLFRGSPVNLNLQDWLYKWVFPKEAHMTAETVRRGAALSILELMKGGTAAMADMYYLDEGTSAAALAAGTRLVLTIDGKTSDSQGRFTQDVEAVEDFAKRWRNHSHIRPSLQVHSPYLYQEDLYPVLSQVARDNHLPVQVHVAETKTEVSELAAKYHASPVELLQRWNLLLPGSILAHNVYLTDEDIRILLNYDVSLVTNPASNCKLGSGIADTEKLRQKGLRVVLGTDGAGSNDTLDMFRELRLAGFLAKATHTDPMAGRADIWLYWATAGGYDAIGFSDAGHLAAGEAADFMIYNPHHLGNEPYGEHVDPIALLSYSGSPAGVETLVVGGKHLVKNYESVTLDEERVIFEAREAVADLG